jgi:alkanesulfonate monooxygenase SsuD/methylene tetrahydromethanopterin reductase-like flavin-dependent oxidoreductase (luciferase family)
MLELTGEIADGWLGTSFVLEGADEAGLSRAVASRKKELAFSLGGMGPGTSNFYNNAYSRQGWADVAAQVRERWQSGDRDGAAGLITDEMVLATTLIGTEDMVRARLKTWRDTGVDTVRLYPAGDTLAARLDNLARGIDLVRALGPG